MPTRRLLAALAGAVLAAVPAPAADPFDLVRGLREAGSADLAVEYLAELEKGAPPEVKAVLPLERAQARLDLAAAEGDTAARAGLVNQARADFDLFLRTAAGHPRRAEAAAALARLVGVQARGELAAANGISGDVPRSEALAAARGTFADAAKRFADAAGAVDAARKQPNLAPAAKTRAEAAYLQARVDEGVNLFLMSQTLTGTSTAALGARADAVNKARAAFESLAKADPSQPLTYVARAWAGECHRALTDPKKAEAAFEEVKAAASKSAAAAAGARLARFFEAKALYEAALGTAGNKGPALQRSQAALEAWLADAPRGGRPTPEQAAARYYVGFGKYLQGAALLAPTKDGQFVVNDSARAFLRAAERDFRRLADPANDYSARAAEFRLRAVRLLVGDPDKAAPDRMTDFDLVLMSGQVLLARLPETPDPGKKAETAKKAAALFDRLAELPVPPDLLRDAETAAVTRVYALLVAGRPHEAATLGEHLARTARAAPAARAGLYAVQAYRQVLPADPKDGGAELARAAAVARLLDAKYPLDPNTDAARLAAARMLVAAGRFRDGFDLAAKVPGTSASAPDARFVQSVAALDLLRAEGADADARKAVSARAIADLSALPPAPPAAADADAKTDVLVRLQLAELYVLRTPPDLAKAEAVAAAAQKSVGAFTNLSEPSRKELQARADLVRVRTAYGQAAELFKANDFPAAAAKLKDPLADAARGPAAAGLDPGTPAAAVAARLDEFRRDRLLGLALQVKLRTGETDQIAPLLDTLKKLGGLANPAGTLGPVLNGIRPQLDAMRKAGKGADADRVAKSLGDVLGQVAAAPGTDAVTLVVLGRGLRELGDTAKAAELLAKVPAPANKALLNPGAAVPEADRKAVGAYLLAQLELCRALRQAKKFPEADALVKTGSTWATATEFRKEAAFLLEARAAEGGPDAKKQWAEAYQAWNVLANGYAGPLRGLLAGKKDPKSAVLALLNLRVPLPPHPRLPKAEADIRRGLADAKQPDWVKPVLEDADFQAKVQAKITELDAQLRPLYHDNLAESFRCLTLANEGLLKGNAAGLAAKYDGIAKSLVELETANPDLANPATAGPARQKLAALLADRPPLRDAYTKRGGKAFAP